MVTIVSNFVRESPTIDVQLNDLHIAGRWRPTRETAAKAQGVGEKSTFANACSWSQIPFSQSAGLHPILSF